MIKEERRRKKRRKIGLYILLILILLIAAGVFIVMNVFTVENVVVQHRFLVMDKLFHSLAVPYFFHGLFHIPTPFYLNLIRGSRAA